MIAAIEIYNKPKFEYRDECVVILFMNAWELLLKALVSKNGKSIYYRKRRNQPYRTLSWQDAISAAGPFFPRTVDLLPVRRNLDLLGTYRDNAIHFYNAGDFGVLIYALAQTSITNFRDLMHSAFGMRLEDEINLRLLPLGLRPPIDPLTYISGRADGQTPRGEAVEQFLSALRDAVDEIEDAKGDTARLLTIFNVKLESTKKIEKADVLVGVSRSADEEGPLAIIKTQDPNVTHPLRQKEVVDRIGALHGRKFTSYTFQAIASRYDLKQDSRYCWIATEGVLTRYSHDAVAFIKTLSVADVDTAVALYKSELAARREVVTAGRQ